MATIEIPNPQYHSFSIDISRARREIGYAPANDFCRMADRAIEARAAIEQRLAAAGREVRADPRTQAHAGEKQDESRKLVSVAVGCAREIPQVPVQKYGQQHPADEVRRGRRAPVPRERGPVVHLSKEIRRALPPRWHPQTPERAYLCT